MNISLPHKITNYKDFINIIIEHFHMPTRHLFQEILHSLTIIIKDYSERKDITELQHHIKTFFTAMEEHLQKEESILFPLI